MTIERTPEGIKVFTIASVFHASSARLYALTGVWICRQGTEDAATAIGQRPRSAQYTAQPSTSMQPAHSEGDAFSSGRSPEPRRLMSGEKSFEESWVPKMGFLGICSKMYMSCAHCRGCFCCQVSGSTSWQGHPVRPSPFLMGCGCFWLAARAMRSWSWHASAAREARADILF
jgi:hypothetical protein